MTFSVMITTRNRSDQLRETLTKLSCLDPQPLEVLVTADGCEDDTEQVVRSEFPNVDLVVNSVGRGSVASREAMMKEAKGDLVLALDDDSHPENLNCLAILEDLFRQDTKLAVATFPQRTDEYPETLEQENFGETRPVRSFPNSGACFRMSTYRELAGFEPMFFHMYEEPDYALQCVGNGWKILLFTDITIRHYWTPNQRSEIRNHHLHSRNEFWSTLMRCPFPQAFFVALWRVISQARFAAKRGPKWLIREPLWWIDGMKGSVSAFARRRPVSWQGYRNWLSLPDR